MLQHQESNQYPSVISREKISSIENSLALSASGQQSQLTSGLSTLTSVHSGGNNGIQSGSSTSYNRNRRSLTASSKYRSQFAAKHQQANQQVRNIFFLNISKFDLHRNQLLKMDLILNLPFLQSNGLAFKEILGVFTVLGLTKVSIFYILIPTRNVLMILIFRTFGVSR